MSEMEITTTRLPDGIKTHKKLLFAKMAADLEFAIDIAPIGQEPKLVGKAFRDTPAHIYAGASLLVAGA
jgi:hypothetical protein